MWPKGYYEQSTFFASIFYIFVIKIYRCACMYFIFYSFSQIFLTDNWTSHGQSLLGSAYCRKDCVLECSPEGERVTHHSQARDTWECFFVRQWRQERPAFQSDGLVSKRDAGNLSAFAASKSNPHSICVGFFVSRAAIIVEILGPQVLLVSKYGSIHKIGSQIFPSKRITSPQTGFQIVLAVCLLQRSKSLTRLRCPQAEDVVTAVLDSVKPVRHAAPTECRSHGGLSSIPRHPSHSFYARYWPQHHLSRFK